MFTKFNLKSKIAAVAAATLGVGANAFASEADQLIQGMNQGLTQSADSFVNLVLVIVGLVGIIFVVINAIKYFKGGEQNGENGLFKVGIGLILAVIIIYVIKEVFLGGTLS